MPHWLRPLSFFFIWQLKKDDNNVISVTNLVIEKIRTKVNRITFDTFGGEIGSTTYSVSKYVYVVVFFVIAYSPSVRPEL